MRTRHIIFAIIFPIFIFSSCSEDDNFNRNDYQVIARFTSSISGEIKVSKTKASGSAWDINDKIGIYAKKSGLNLTGNVINSYENVKYVTAGGNGNFLPDAGSSSFNYPLDGSAVDFIAYYPYQPTLNNFIYKVNLTDQTSQEKIDLLYSNNAIAHNSTNPNPNLSFTHELVKINLNITAGKGTSSLSGLNVKISGFATKGDFDLANGSLSVDNTSISDVTTLLTVKSTTNVMAEAILLPSSGGTNKRKITFSFEGGKSQTYNIPDTDEFRKGRKYTYNVILKNGGPAITPSYGPIENPLIDGAMPNMIYVQHLADGSYLKAANPVRNYSLYYDTQYKLAYWVAYPLNNYYIGDHKRTNKWQFDPAINRQYQPNLSSSWVGENWDRGHQIPSADRTKDSILNVSTFYYSNMTAQHTFLNTRVWAKLEDKVRAWATASDCDTMYVVTGAMITTQSDPTIEYVADKFGSKSAKPKYFYKVLAKRKNDTYTTIGFRFDNKEYSISTNYMNYTKTVKELEDETGFTFFPSLNGNIKDKIDVNKWK